MFIPVGMVWGFVMLIDLPMNVLANSVMSVFIFSRTIAEQPETKWSTVSSY